MTSEVEPGLVLLWIMERMDGVSIADIAKREKKSYRTIRKILVDDYGCPAPLYRIRDEWHEALALWNTGTFTWNQVAHECRIDMDGTSLRDRVYWWAKKNKLKYRGRGTAWRG